MKILLDAGHDPYSPGDFAALWKDYEDYLYSLHDPGNLSMGEIQHIVKIHIDDSIRKIAATLHSMFGNDDLMVDHFMCTAASGLYHMMDDVYRNKFDDMYDSICGNPDVFKIDNNKLGCHD